jgi:hypothetical protein
VFNKRELDMEKFWRVVQQEGGSEQVSLELSTCATSPWRMHFQPFQKTFFWLFIGVSYDTIHT